MGFVTVLASNKSHFISLQKYNHATNYMFSSEEKVFNDFPFSLI